MGSLNSASKLNSYSRNSQQPFKRYETIDSKILSAKKIQQLQKFVDLRDVDGFTKAFKHIAYSLGGVDAADDMLPCMVELFDLVDATVSM